MTHKTEDEGTLTSQVGSPAILHISAELFSSIDPEVLSAAAEVTGRRYRSFDYRIKQQLGAGRLVPDGKPFKLSEVPAYPCTPFGRSLFRVYHTEHMVALEFDHVLCDIFAASEYLKTLLCVYHRMKGIAVPESGLIIEAESAHDPAESAGVSIGQVPLRRKRISRAFHVSGMLADAGTLRVIRGTLDTEELRKRCSVKESTATEYLLAVYLFSLYEIQRDHGIRALPIRVAVPVDLRSFFDIRSMRDCSLDVRTGIEPALGDYSFEEILFHVHHSLQFSMHRNHLQAAFTMRQHRRISLLQLLPLTGRRDLVHEHQRSREERSISGCISDLGTIELPEALSEHIRGFDLIPGGSRINTESCGLLEYKGRLIINFSRISNDPIVARRFFRNLTASGIPVDIHSSW